MSNLRITYTEEMVGYGHPTKTDTLNRFSMVEHNEDGTHKNVPAGAMISWPTEVVPSGWLERNGASLDRTTYAALFAALGTLYGAADGNHFNIPDHRGGFPRYWDHGLGVDPDRATRTKVGAAGATMTAGDHVGTEQGEGFKSHDHQVYGIAATAAGPGAVQAASGYMQTGAAGGNETRPVNRNVMPIIKY